MKLKIYTLSVFIMVSFMLAGQHIRKIIDYRPAPGQFINLSSTGTQEAAQSITGPERGLVSLGSAGGYIVFQFDQPVVNHPDHPYGVDFTLFGNPLAEWSEPGIVYVMKDANRNNLPDDIWYPLAGSDYFFSDTQKEHSIVYFKPEKENYDVHWENNTGNSGNITHNSYHQQSYYPGTDFEYDFYHKECQFELIRISGQLDPYSAGAIKSYARAFGFADNWPAKDWNAELPDNPYTWEQEGHGGDPFDLSWAINDQGQYINLDTIHFVKVQTSMYGIEKVVGEISTELTGGRLIKPAPAITGENRMLVIEEPVLPTQPGDYQLRAYYFEHGRYLPDKQVEWEVLEGDVQISDSGLIHLASGMDVTIRACLKSNVICSQSLDITISELATNESGQSHFSDRILVWPNPASDYLNLELMGPQGNFLHLHIKDIRGRVLWIEKIYEKQYRLDISELDSGIYFIVLYGENINQVKKIIKR